jgi:hypothetical protein
VLERLKGRQGKDGSVLVIVESLQYMRDRFLMMAMATVHARASEHVYGIEERLAKR